MRMVKYKTHWAYLGPAIPRTAALADFVLDIPYFLDPYGIIPPLAVLNDFLRTGGTNGGMGPGTTWRSFQVRAVDYAEMVQVLLTLDMTTMRDRHPYVDFARAIVDEELNACLTYRQWRRQVRRKYGPDQRSRAGGEVIPFEALDAWEDAVAQALAENRELPETLAHFMSWYRQHAADREGG